MHFFFDESGSFTETSEQEDFGVVVGAIIPDSSMLTIEHAYANFSRALATSEKPQGEPKGKCLTKKSRLLFAEFVDSFPEIKIVPTVLDIRMSDCRHLAGANKVLSATAQKRSSNYVYPEMRDFVKEFGRQIGNLGKDQLPHLFSVTKAIWNTLQIAIVNFASPTYRPDWNELDFQIDHTSSRGEAVFEKLLTLWLPAWNKYEPVRLIQGIHEPGHPLIDRYHTPRGFDIKKMLRDRLRFVDSQASAGVQIADIAANSLLRALRDPSNSAENHQPVVSMLRNTYLMKSNPIGLFALGDKRVHPTCSEHRLLIQAIRNSRAG